ncbi:uncharacterized protein LOC122945077 isoform X1 [Bufo gargarizans]|uniref:uncharacterized protein LOC122945077 isoform X1 n=1 Tax=Bufo gargarizans TaxID=30331 RepID=UPI001CF0E069|nr:uncharacterized protein LOC122945077 isoform X1 [Bufo gargarizans]XP_044159853.1 uncharacterized protein LOC122945077 isoform X1 [Bufo gargarizans]XP_044159854.1 uncharacterized protein LOC122945077 isoform X1 [Bufo gargarizans]XP_044159855.1 uncharacterized protein LOC122945077 isoform X1 [Bufo gargarizans]XP_044159856.1 uncharacterized protein LOC122945077 isoform X1 [Bufo gargarizans]
MEEAPKGTFEEELEWCIHQLETGLLRRNPTPRQVTDTQRVLRVLRSRKAPFVKKRQVMNQIFGNYRLQMAEARQAQERAANDPPEPQIQEVTARDAQSIAYRKSSKDVESGGGHCSTPSSSDFSFNFFPDQNAEGSTGAEDHAKEVKCPDPPTSQQDGAVCLDGGLAFTFNFQITEKACSTSESSSAPQATHNTSGDHLDPNHMAQAVAQERLSSTLDMVASSSGVTAKQTEDKSTAESPKKKKKKSKTKNVVAQTQNKVEEPRGKVDPVPPLKEEPKLVPQSGADELRRELDWCVEQLEIGLQRQKSTPKQVEEALRAIKTLRSEKVQLVKKRQVMRLMFGDYRLKMEEERVKQLRLMQAAAKSAKMTTVTRTARQNSSKVFRKSVHKSSRNAAPNSAAPADSQGISDQTAAPSSSSQQEFSFRPSQEAFCFNFF